MATEEPNYTLLTQIEDFELRRYEVQLVAETWVTGDRKEAGRIGFERLAGYIFGNNTALSGGNSEISTIAAVKIQPSANNSDSMSQKIAMTAPVSMQQTQDKWRVRFVMPNQYTLQTLPKPNDPEVRIVEIPVQTYGVIKFSGLTGSDKVDAKTQALQDWMASQNLTIIGAPELARYNPPWTLPFMRRNEVMIAYQQ